LNVTGDLTLEAWVMPDELPAVGNKMAVLFKASGTAENQRTYALFITSNGAVQFQRASSLGVTTATTAANLVKVDEWTHVAATMDLNLGQVKIYVNGVLAQTFTMNNTSSGVSAAGAALRIGNALDSTPGVVGFNGAIDE